MKFYEVLDHTADLRIQVYADSLTGLYIHAAAAMYELIADIGCVKPATSVSVISQGQDRDDLLHNWLSELLYFFTAKGILLSKFDIKRLTENRIVSNVRGEQIDSSRHSLKHDIKAITYHDMHISDNKGKFQTNIVFDV